MSHPSTESQTHRTGASTGHTTLELFEHSSMYFVGSISQYSIYIPNSSQLVFFGSMDQYIYIHCIDIDIHIENYLCNIYIIIYIYIHYVHKIY